MEIIPVANRTSRRRNALLDAADRARSLINDTTPEPDFVDPTTFDPVTRNPQPVQDAIAALGSARTEGNVAASELARQNFNRQVQQLILQNVLGVAGAIGNIGGGQTQTGITQRADQSFATALGLQDQLSRIQQNAAREIPLVQAQTALQQAQLEEDARFANEQAEAQSRRELSNAMLAAEERARREGVDIRTALQQELSNAQRDRQLGISEEQAASARVNAQANLARALRPPASSGSSKNNPKNLSRELFDNVLGGKARAGEARTQIQSLTNPNIANPPSPFEQQAGEVVAREAFEQEQIVSDNLARFSGTLRRVETEDVGVFFSEALQARDPDLLDPIIDELRKRSAANDPVIRKMEAEANQGRQNPMSFEQRLDLIEQRIESGQF